MIMESVSEVKKQNLFKRLRESITLFFVLVKRLYITLKTAVCYYNITCVTACWVYYLYSEPILSFKVFLNLY